MVGAFDISEDFINWLDKTFPNNLPTDKECNIEKIRFLQGQQDVINVIKSIYKESIEDVYESSI
ncbi:MAG: hypothetical protein Unbinned202contig1000_14 [Prokaryotic dsDNA virus sp.]|nr:MAG: hypothetical protein Unbinned202contig1000_14 [Prokaryotic dsDNA virus sp.]|tara:strand:- start:19576 stop:19767 length:192 start_codon:yes stop_codon:yes gene_type:complete